MTAEKSGHHTTRESLGVQVIVSLTWWVPALAREALARPGHEKRVGNGEADVARLCSPDGARSAQSGHAGADWTVPAFRLVQFHRSSSRELRSKKALWIVSPSAIVDVAKSPHPNPPIKSGQALSRKREREPAEIAAPTQSPARGQRITISCPGRGSAPLWGARAKSGDPYVDGPRLARVVQQRIGSLAIICPAFWCGHMTAGQDGFRDASSKQCRDVSTTGFRGVSRVSDRPITPSAPSREQAPAPAEAMVAITPNSLCLGHRDHLPQTWARCERGARRKPPPRAAPRPSRPRPMSSPLRAGL